MQYEARPTPTQASTTKSPGSTFVFPSGSTSLSNSTDSAGPGSAPRSLTAPIGRSRPSWMIKLHANVCTARLPFIHALAPGPHSHAP